MFTETRNKHGFTLIELTIVVVIIGILAALAIPRYMLGRTRSKQSEAREMLKQIHAMQTAYESEFNSYCLNGVTASADAQTAFASLGAGISADARYSYTMEATATTFKCTATANLDSDETIDTWTIDQTGTLINIIDDCGS